MARKKKQSRKYTPRNEFRQNHSPSARGHYDYVFGETSNYYKSIGLTTNENDKYPKYRLTKNPDPMSTDESYLRLKTRSTLKRYMPKIEIDWQFDEKDMPIVRRIIKTYKKSFNRKPKNWYINKKKWHKKR